MPRSNNGSEIFKVLTALDKYIPASGGDQTFTTAVTTGVTLCTVGATTSFVSADPVILFGDGGMELNAITGTPATAMPLLYKTSFAQSVGGRLLEMQKIVLGDIDPAGVQFTPSQQLTEVMSALSSVPIATIPGAVQMSATFSLLGWNNLNLQEWFGITEGESGAGSTADPYYVAVGESNIGNASFKCYRLTGTLFDGRTVQLDFNDARVQVGGTAQFNRGQNPANMPVTVKFNNLVQRIFP